MRKKVLVVGLCCAMLLSGCSLSTKEIGDAVDSGIEAAKEQAGGQATEAPQETEEPKEKELSLGEKATIDDWKVNVKKVEIKSKIPNGQYRVFKPSKGQKFVSVTMTVKNNGKKAATFLPRMGMSDTMITANLYYKDYEYNATNLLSYDKELLQKSIKPLETVKGTVTFEVPKKAAKKKSDLTLRIGKESDGVIYKIK